MTSVEYTSAAVASEIRISLRALLESRSSFVTETGTVRKFTDDDEEGGIEGKYGPYASMQGLRTVFGTLIALPDSATWQLVTPELPSLLEEWETVMASPDVLMACRPYDAKPVHATLQRPETQYTDAAAWAVSVAISVNYLWSEFEARTKPGSRDATLRFLADALDSLLSLQASDGSWTWRRNATAGHLYFTWTALQGLADYYDYVDGESYDDIGVKRDNDTFNFLEQRGLTRTRIDAARARAAAFLDPLAQKVVRGQWTAKDLLFNTPEETIAIDDGDENPIRDCYLFAYLQESLILAAYDSTPQRRRAIDDLHDILKQQYARGNDWLSARKDEGAPSKMLAELGTLHLTVTTRTKRNDATFKLQDPSLWPQLLRTFVLYTYYVSRASVIDGAIMGPNSAYSALMADRIAEGPRASLWDASVFNLAITCRGMEGLIDVCDELARLERPVSDDVSTRSDLAASIAAAVYPWIAKQLGANGAAPMEIAGGAGINSPSGPSIEELCEEILSWARRPLQQRPNDKVRTSWLARSEMGKPDVDFMTELLGTDAKSFERDSPVAHALFRAIAAVSIAAAARLLPRILESAVLNLASEPILRRLPDNAPENPIRQALDERLGDFYEAVAGKPRLPVSKTTNTKPTR